MIYTNGFFYSLRTTGGDVRIRRSTTLAGMASGTEVTVFTPNADTRSDISFNFELTAAAAFAPAALNALVAANQLQLARPGWAAGYALAVATNLTPLANWIPRRSHQQPVARDALRRDERPALLPAANAVRICLSRAGCGGVMAAPSARLARRWRLSIVSAVARG